MTVRPIKTTILGGIVFLVPVIIALAILGEAFKLMAVLAAPLAAWVPVDSLGGFAIANIITILALLIVCYSAGLIASGVYFRRLQRSLDDKLLTLFPRYIFVRSVTESLVDKDGGRTLQPVKVSFDDHVQIAFEVERDGTGRVTIYLPGAPDPWSGSILHVTEDRVTPISASVNDVIQRLRSAGRGAGSILE